MHKVLRFGSTHGLSSAKFKASNKKSAVKNPAKVFQRYNALWNMF